MAFDAEKALQLIHQSTFTANVKDKISFVIMILFIMVYLGTFDNLQIDYYGQFVLLNEVPS